MNKSFLRKSALYLAVFFASISFSNVYAHGNFGNHQHSGGQHSNAQNAARGREYHNESQRTSGEALLQQHYNGQGQLNRDANYYNTGVNGVQNPMIVEPVVPVTPVVPVVK